MPIQRFDCYTADLRDVVSGVSITDGIMARACVCLSRDVAELEEAYSNLRHAYNQLYLRNVVEENARNEPVVRTAGQE